MAEEEKNQDFQEEVEAVEEEPLEEEEELLDYDEILDEYRRRQMIEHLTGPMISVVLHVAIIIVLAIMMVGSTTEETTAVEFDTEEMDVKPVDPDVLEELDDLQEEFTDDPVPTVERPDIRPEEVRTETSTDFAEQMANADMAFEVSTMLAPPVRSRLVVGGIWSNRTDEGRRGAIARFGGSAATERAVLRALEWLKNNQRTDGSWAGGEGQTGLALLAFLAHGERHDSEEYGDTVTGAINWLVRYMAEKKWPGRRPGAYMNGIATYALAEAYALTELPMIVPAVERGLEILIKGQQYNGGFGYGYARGSEEKPARWDMSVGSWQFQALKAAKAAGIEVSGMDNAIKRGIKWMKTVVFQGPRFYYSSEKDDKETPEIIEGEDPSGAVTGAGALCLQLLGEADADQVKSAIDWIRDNMNHDYDPPPLYAHYVWYYQTQAMFHAGEGKFRAWNHSFAPMLVRNQEPDGHWALTPTSTDAGMNEVYSTALCALSLQVYYRYLPTYQVVGGKDEEEKESALDFDDDEDLGLDVL